MKSHDYSCQRATIQPTFVGVWQRSLHAGPRVLIVITQLVTLTNRYVLHRTARGKTVGRRPARVGKGAANWCCRCPCDRVLPAPTATAMSVDGNCGPGRRPVTRAQITYGRHT